MNDLTTSADGDSPKPTVHRMLQQLEQGDWLLREPDGRRHALTPRLQEDVRHAVLSQLAECSGICRITALTGAQVVYQHRVKSAFPLRLELHLGTPVPLHARPAASCYWRTWARRAARPRSKGWC